MAADNHCPNCAARLVAPAPAEGHRHGCLLYALLTVVQDRGSASPGHLLADIDVGQLWDRFGGPAADWLEAELAIDGGQEPDGR